MSITVIPPEKKTNEISVIAEKIDTGLQAFEQRKADLILLKDEAAGLKITSIEEVFVITQVSVIRKKLKKARTAIETEGKSMRDPLTKLSKMISEKEKELVAIIEPTEKELLSQEMWVDREIDKIKQAAIDARLEQLSFTGKQFDRIYIGSLDNNTFEMVVKSHKADYEKEQAEKAEAERVRIEEAANLKAERDEMNRVKAEQLKAQAIIDAENNRIKKEQQKLEEDKLAVELDRKRIEIERQRDIDIKQAASDAAENARLKAIESARIETETKVTELQEAKEKEERRLALQPDKEKLEAFVKQLVLLEYFETSNPKVQDVLTEVSKMIGNVQSYIHGKIYEL